MSDGFDGWLEQELHAGAGGNGPAAEPADARFHSISLNGGTRMKVFGKVAAILSAKGALGLVVGVLAVSAASVAGGASIAGGIGLGNWGSQVVQQVDKCKDALATGERGIGQCVSAFAKTHGQQVASGARQNQPTDSPKNHGNGNGNGNGNGHSNGNANGHSKGNGNGHGNGNSQSGGGDTSAG